MKVSLNEIYQHRWGKNLQDSPSKITHFYTNFHTKSNTILFTTLKDNHLQLINGDKRKDDERKKWINLNKIRTKLSLKYSQSPISILSFSFWAREEYFSGCKKRIIPYNETKATMKESHQNNCWAMFTFYCKTWTTCFSSSQTNNLLSSKAATNEGHLISSILNE